MSTSRVDTTKIIIRDLRVDMLIGIHEHEKRTKQPVLVNVEVLAEDRTHSDSDTIEDTVCYDRIVKMIRALVAKGHINLVETLAEEIAADILHDRQAQAVTVRVEKTAVYNDAAAAGVEIFRKKK